MDWTPHEKMVNDWVLTVLPILLSAFTGILMVFLPWLLYQARRKFQLEGDAALFAKQKEMAATAVRAVEQHKQQFVDAPGNTHTLMKNAAASALQELAPQVTDSAAPLLIESAVREMKEEKKAGLRE